MKDIDFLNLNDIQDAPPTIPQGEYHLKITDAAVKENQAKDGHYINYRVTVQTGPHAGESFFGMWSLKPTALWRMKKDFKAMGYSPAGGVPHITDLIGFEGIAKVKDEPAKDGRSAKNSVDAWLGPIS